MESNQTLTKEKLKLGPLFFDIIEESLKLFTRSSSLMLLTVLTSIPLFCFLVLQELAFQHIINQTVKDVSYDPPCDFSSTSSLCDYLTWDWRLMDYIAELILAAYQKFLLLGLFYLGVGNFLDLLSSITTVYSASVLYTGQDTPTLKEMLCRPFRKVGFRGPWTTSIYGLVLSSVSVIGFLSLATQLSITHGGFFLVTFGLLFVAFFTKCMEWMAVCNMGLVISILEEEKHGDVAIVVSANISRGSRRRGFLLTLIFFIWRVMLRFSGLYMGWNKGMSAVLITITIGQICLVCYGNAVKWNAFTIYYYDCKRRSLEKKAYVEQVSGAETEI